MEFNRRQWLKTAGFTGAFSLFDGFQTFAREVETTSKVFPTTLNLPIRLSANENPYGPSEKVRQAMIDAFDKACRYPYGFASDLRKMIAAKHGLTPDHVVITAGSTEGLNITGLTYGLGGKEIVSPFPTFRSLMDYGRQFGAYVHEVPVKEDFNHDLQAMDQRITNNTSLVYVCNPNNPTGTLLDAKELISFCSNASRKTTVFVDEAYFDYIEIPDYPSCDTLVKKGENVIVTRTFSKIYGMAGIRIGYLLARPDIAKRLDDNMPAFTNALALFAAKTAMEDHDFYKFSLEKTQKGKAIIYDALKEIGLNYIPSHTNFVFFETGQEIVAFNKTMSNLGVQVGRPFPPFNKWCRISVGTLEETKFFADKLKTLEF